MKEIVLTSFVRSDFNYTVVNTTICSVTVNTRICSKKIKFNDRFGERYVFYISEQSDKNVTLKIAMIGDPMIGKTALMVKFVEEKYDEDYIATLGSIK